MKILAYISFGIEVAAAVPLLIAMFSSAVPLTGAAILAAIEPALSGAQAAFGHSIPDVLASDIANAVADAINNYRKAVTPAA
jgi:hypothetical protein